jgi:Zn finger protein HypA/HybF involved in hydrogenase expression
MNANDTSWLNRMVTMRCADCNHEWVQPSDVGRCPKCHSDHTEAGAKRINVLPRV